MWLYYWLATYGINPMKDAKIITVPPPQMVANMRVGNMDGYCVGEPWGHRAIVDGIGITGVTTQDIWKDHPEKALGTHRRLRQEVPEHLPRRDRWPSSRPAAGSTPACRTRLKMAETVADKAYVNTSVDVINQRILGRYQNGLGKTWDDPNHMKFFNDGAVNFPYLTDGMWFLTQHKRWGLLKEHPDYLGVAKQINQIELYKQAASRAEGQRAEGRRCARSKLIDGVVWDGKDPAKYADGFKVKRLSAADEESTMVSAVFHSPLDAAAEPRSRRAAKPARRGRAAAPSAAAAVAARAAQAAVRLARAVRCKVLPPVVGIALLVGIWALLTMKSSTLPDAGRDLRRGGQAVLRPVLPQGAERPGHRLEHPVLAAARRRSASAWRRWSAFRWAS